MDTQLWPARNVAEYEYCPRLFYFMEVEGIHVPSSDTEEGQRIHRRVDKPSAAASMDVEGLHKVRSLTLTSERLGLTATLDLAEIEGSEAVPFEYRKGRPKRIYDQEGEVIGYESWPTDRVQIGLQAFLLEEAGYKVSTAAIYYAAEKRRLTLLFDDKLRKEALETLEAARTCATGSRPLPLVNDSRCPRCSLQPVCLPDEVNSLREMLKTTAASEATSARKLWPPRDDGIHLVTQRRGTRVGIRASTLRVTEADGTKTAEVPLAGVESLSLVGSVQISTQALHTLADRSIPVAYLSRAGRLIACVDPLDAVSADTRRNQVRRLDCETDHVELSRALITAKIRNQRVLLQRNGAASVRVLDALNDELNRAGEAESVDSIRGHEGQAAALYFGSFATMVKDEALASAFDENGRRRRPPPDPVNTCLSLAYSMLTHECVASLRTARLEPSIGALHVSRPGRPALALDLMEPFRPLIADSLTISAFNRGELRDGHFHQTSAGCMFTDAGRKAFFSIYGRRMSEEVTHPVFGYRLCYRRMLILHARMIAAWFNREVPSLSFLTTR